MTSTAQRIGCIGAGLLGRAIMRRMIDCGFPVSVWNRTPGRLAELVEAGAAEADSPRELCRGVDIVITCVTDGAAVEQVVFGEVGVAAAGSPDKLLIDMSTMDASHARALSQRLHEHCGMRWLDAPISGGAPAALAGGMAVMVGGRESDFERARPVWNALAGRATLMGASGAGQSTKMINQVLVSCGFAVLAEACALAQRAGVDAARIPHALAGGRADSRLLQEYMPKMAKSDFSPEGRIDSMLKDLELIRELAREHGAAMPVTGLVTELHRKLVADGLGERDNAEMVRLYRP